MGADLGLGIPVAAFQIKNSARDRMTTYKVYSLDGPPRLLRTITGGDFYSAADRNSRAELEIWTDDAGAVDGFENIPLSALDFAPTVVLRFEKQRLIDVSAEYQSDFDRQIAQVKSQLDAQALDEFKSSDGKLEPTLSSSTERLNRLLTTKSKVLEIVWADLYSGREEEAWRALAAMWPPADFGRIRGAILDAQVRGIRRQVDGVSTPGSRPLWTHHAHIYEMDTEAIKTVDMANGKVTTAPYTETTGAASLPSMEAAGSDEKTPLSMEALPEPIYLGTPLTQIESQPALTSKVYLQTRDRCGGKGTFGPIIQRGG